MYGKKNRFKKEGIIEKISYEGRSDESVDDIGASLKLYLKKQRKTKLRH